MAVRNAWLNQVHEDPIDPDMPICDPHHHLWDHEGNRYLLDELLADTDGHRVVSTVFVECLSEYRASGPQAMRPVGETEFVERVASECQARSAIAMEPCTGIVGFADLLLGSEVREVLEAHLDASPNRFRGIRHAAGWDDSPEIRNSHSNPPQGLYLMPGFREGFAHLERLELVFDSWLYFTQLPELADLARAFPGVTIVVDHVGGPLGIGPYADRRSEVFDVWVRHLTRLAKCPNVVVKFGGLQMPICGFGWHRRRVPPTSEEIAAATKPFFVHCLDAFGARRCMFESNFPVDKASCSYTVLWNSFKRLASDLSDSERTLLFHDNAIRVYRLDGRPARSDCR